MDKSQVEKELVSMANEILTLSKNTLLVNFRFLDRALSRPSCEPNPFICGIATNGENIFYDPRAVLSVFKNEKEEVSRAYLHMIMHCIFRHMFMHTLMDKTLWNIACDIAVESAICDLDTRCVSTSKESRQKPLLDALKSKIKLITAERVYAYFMSNSPSEQMLKTYHEVFACDDHMPWYLGSNLSGGENGDGEDGNEDEQQGTNSENGDQNEGSGSQFNKNSDGNGENDSQSNENGGKNGENDSQDNQSANKNLPFGPNPVREQDWKDISERINTDLETFSKRQGKDGGGFVQNLKEVNREKYDYTAFLKKFSVLGEAMKINDDEFDYVFYTYGLKLYEKMPLVEPLEYKEVKKIKDFVIAIDTSGSVQGETVQSFLQKTYNILKSQESFFTKINIHIIQCDTKIQHDEKITSQEEFDRYIKTMKLYGFGGTDFRPIFSYVDKLIKDKEFTNLKGLIYFTDGYGTFPSKKPSYNTAFVFVDDEDNIPKIPAWAIKLVLRKNEI